MTLNHDSSNGHSVSLSCHVNINHKYWPLFTCLISNHNKCTQIITRVRSAIINTLHTYSLELDYRRRANEYPTDVHMIRCQTDKSFRLEHFQISTHWPESTIWDSWVKFYVWKPSNLPISKYVKGQFRNLSI